MCKLKAKAGKLWNRAQILESGKGECSKTAAKILPNPKLEKERKKNLYEV